MFQNIKLQIDELKYQNEEIMDIIKKENEKDKRKNQEEEILKLAKQIELTNGIIENIVIDHKNFSEILESNNKILMTILKKFENFKTKSEEFNKECIKNKFKINEEDLYIDSIKEKMDIIEKNKKIVKVIMEDLKKYIKNNFQINNVNHRIMNFEQNLMNILKRLKKQNFEKKNKKNSSQLMSFFPIFLCNIRRINKTDFNLVNEKLN